MESTCFFATPRVSRGILGQPRRAFHRPARRPAFFRYVPPGAKPISACVTTYVIRPAFSSCRAFHPSIQVDRYQCPEPTLICATSMTTKVKPIGTLTPPAPSASANPRQLQARRAATVGGRTSRRPRQLTFRLLRPSRRLPAPRPRRTPYCRWAPAPRFLVRPGLPFSLLRQLTLRRHSFCLVSRVGRPIPRRDTPQCARARAASWSSLSAGPFTPAACRPL